MTEPLSQVERPSGGGLAGAIGPEAVAAMLSFVVVVALIGARFASVGGGAVSPTPSPSSAATDIPTRTAPTFDVGAARQLLIVNQNLYRQGLTLQAQLDPPPGVDTDKIRTTFGNMGPQLASGTTQATALGRTPTGAPVATELLAVYAKIDGIIEGLSNTALTSQPPWQKAAADVVETMKLLPPLDDQLTALLAGPPPSPSGAPSGSPSVAPSTSVPPSASAAPTATAVPSAPPSTPPTAPPSASASVPASVPPTLPPGPNPVQNPGFEQGVGPPWALVLIDQAQASPAPDGVNPYAGSLSARIDITEPTFSRARISLQQKGISIDAGAYYDVSVALRSSASRVVLIRIASSSGQTLGNGSQLFTIGPEWTVQRFQMTSIAPSDDASIAIDVGGSPETVWVDDVSISRINSGAP